MYWFTLFIWFTYVSPNMLRKSPNDWNGLGKVKKIRSGDRSWELKTYKWKAVLNFKQLGTVSSQALAKQGCVSPNLASFPCPLFRRTWRMPLKYLSGEKLQLTGACCSVISSTCKVAHWFLKPTNTASRTKCFANLCGMGLAPFAFSILQSSICI